MKKILHHPRVLKAKTYIKNHKIIFALIFILLGAISYWTTHAFGGSSPQTRYVLQTVEKGMLISSITGSGQVGVTDQVDIKPKASGDIISINIKNGQEVKAGTIIARIDSRDAEKSVRDAEVSLESAQLSMQKLQAPADTLTLIQSENSLESAKQSKTSAEYDLTKAYGDGYSAIANTFLDLPAIVQGLHDLLYGTTVTHGSQDNISAYADMVRNYDDNVLNYRDDAALKYAEARTAYEKTLSDYKATSRTADSAALEALINETYLTVKSIAESVKASNNFLDFVEDRLTLQSKTIPSNDAAYQTNLDSYTSKTNSHLSTLLSLLNTIKDSRVAIENANRSILEKEASLSKTKNGPTALDLQSEALALKQRQNTLADAREKLADYYVRAPFDGTIAKLSAKKGDPASSGTAIATLITRQKIATISLNEVDVAKVKIGQKVNLTYDAVDGLNITGEVSDIDTLGTVSQGVVTYVVKIVFDTQDDRIKQGMSTNAAIITDVLQDVLTLPNSAVKTVGDSQYVEVFDKPLVEVQGQAASQGVVSATLPRQVQVQTGISNDTSTEIISGLKEGDQIVSRTITAKTTTATTQAPSLFGGGARATGGGTQNVKIIQ